MLANICSRDGSFAYLFGGGGGRISLTMIIVETSELNAMGS